MLWAMRNRLVSVALPREPQLPTFKVPDGPIEPDSSAAADEDESDPPQATEPQPDAPSLTDISGIGPVYATRLASAGIHTIEQLAEARQRKWRRQPTSPDRAERWIEAARNARTG